MVEEARLVQDIRDELDRRLDAVGVKGVFEDSIEQSIQARVDRERAAYLRWGRDTLGWAIYMFRYSGEATPLT